MIVMLLFLNHQYPREVALMTMIWLGNLPISPPPTEPDEPEELQSVLQSIRYTIDANFEELKDKLSELETKVKTIEEKQLELEKTGPGNSSSSESPSEHHRKRRSPSDLQVGGSSTI